MEDLISIELSFDEWNKVLWGIHCARFLSKDEEREEYKNIHESIYNQIKFDIYQKLKKESQ